MAPRAAVVLVTNPRAGSGRGREAGQRAARWLEAHGAAVRLVESERPGHATALARAAADEGPDVVAAVGGDGTLHEVAAGLHARPVPRPLLGVVPVGTGNDFARTLGLHGATPERAAAALLHGAPRPLDLGRLEGVDAGGPTAWFVNNVGVGYLAAATIERERLRRALPGELGYLVGGFVALARHRAPLWTVDVDGVALTGRFVLLHVANGPWCGAGIRLTPDARTDDGLLDVAVVAERSRLRCLLDWPRLREGTQREDVALLRGRRVRVHGPRGFWLHADGELARVPLGVLEVSLVPRALEVLAPA